MKLFNNYIPYIIIYILSAALFNEYYKLSTKKMKSSGSLTILIELISSIICLFFIPLFKLKFSTNINTYIMLFIAIIFYSIQDRLATISRSGIESSTYSILKQLSTVFMILFGIIILKEKIIIKKLLGSILIIFSNIIVFFNKKIKFNKYILSGIIANISLAIALFIDVNYSKEFNLGFYVFLTLLIPAILVFIFENKKVRDIKEEFIVNNKKYLILTGLFWTVLMLSKLKAYQLGKITLIAPLCSLTVLVNIIFSYFHLKEKSNLIRKIFAAIMIIIGIILIKV